MWTQGKNTVLDVTVVTPIQENLLYKAAAEGGAAANRTHNEKLAVETLASRSPKAIRRRVITLLSK